MLFLGFASNGETKRISTTAAASRILRSAERARRGRPCVVDMLSRPALDDESFEDDSLPPAWPPSLGIERRRNPTVAGGSGRVAQLL